MQAPLPSPALTGPSQPHYFTGSSTGSTNNSTSSSSTSLSSHSQPFTAPQNQRQPQSQVQARPQGQYASHPAQQHAYHQGGGGGEATSPFLRDFNLVAEAAKRAQMAVLMRDFEGVGI